MKNCKYNTLIYIVIFIIGMCILAYIIKPVENINPTSSNIDSIIQPYVDSIAKLDRIIDSLDNLRYGQDSVVIQIRTRYETIKDNIPYYTNDSLDSIIFMEPRFNPLLR